MPLNSNQVKSLSPGSHADGGGLYLIVRDSGERIWQFRFTGLGGKRAAMEFAKVGDRDEGDRMTLSKARETARDYKVALKRHGIDPRVKKKLETKGGTTFKEYAEQTYPGWCVGKHKDEVNNWKRSIADMESLHSMKLHEIDNTHVIAALKPIWWEKPITADRTRQRLEKLFDAAKVEKLRTGDNPAAWKGNLKHVLPSARKLNAKTKKGHASVPYAKAPQLMIALRYETGNSARCVEVGMLTCARSQEIRWMEWTELDFDKKAWLIPGEKMKIKGETAEGKPHLVPLTDQAIEIIQSMPRVGKYVFPSDGKQVEGHEPFLANALTGCIKRCGVKSTMHGLRTTFRNWGADSREHNFRREVLEFCLSHRVGDEAELSYWTSEMLDRRREVMQAWADFIKPKVDTKAETKAETKAGAKPKAKKPSLRLVA
ncbi:site-specific integrase [Bradyrhizobium sp. URHD0069]|uniref:tyrosine-type recombinase/integrase n=1 Tax=Bradyrhizobium sp. URHD0069 TaxID=1380355 RepID=UPI000495171D|nr:site-specific integrase [Bradyrhizobium sp. URHD0069]